MYLAICENPLTNIRLNVKNCNIFPDYPLLLCRFLNSGSFLSIFFCHCGSAICILSSLFGTFVHLIRSLLIHWSTICFLKLG